MIKATQFYPSTTFTFTYIYLGSSIFGPAIRTLLSSQKFHFERSLADLRSFRCDYAALSFNPLVAVANSGVENCLHGTFDYLFSILCFRLSTFPSIFVIFFTQVLKSSQLFSMYRNLYLKKLSSGGGAVFLTVILYFLSMSFSCCSLWISVILSLNAWQSWLQFCQMRVEVPKRCRGHSTQMLAYRQGAELVPKGCILPALTCDLAYYDLKQIIEINSMQQNRIIYQKVDRIYSEYLQLQERQDQSFDYMHKYPSYICSPRLSYRSSSPPRTPTQHYLSSTLSLILIKSSLTRLRIQNLSYAFKQIQFQAFEQNKNAKILKTVQIEHKNNHLIQQKKGKVFYKQKSMQILRKLQTSLQRKKVVRSQQPRPVSKSFVAQRNKIIQQIAQKLEAKNRSPSPLKVEKQQRPHLNRRIARLQTFMQQIKRQRQLNDRPTIILEKKKIDRINYHMLQEKLAEQRKKIDGLNKHKQIFGSLQQIREQLKNMQKVQEMFANPENIQEQPILHKKDQAKMNQSHEQIINETTATFQRQRSQTQHPITIKNIAQPQIFQFSSRPKVRFVNGNGNVGSNSRRIIYFKPQGR